VDRRVKLTLACATNLSARIAHPGRCVYPASATDLQHAHSTDRSALESPPPSAFAADGSFHAGRPAETLAESMIEWSVAWRRASSFSMDCTIIPRFPEEFSLLGPAGSW